MKFIRIYLECFFTALVWEVLLLICVFPVILGRILDNWWYALGLIATIPFGFAAIVWAKQEGE